VTHGAPERLAGRKRVRRAHRLVPFLAVFAVSHWKSSPVRAELLALYARVDALLAPWSCEASTDCCRFGVTGREPYVTPPEIAEVERAIAALGGLRVPSAGNAGRRGRGGRGEKRRLPVAGAGAGAEDERRCALLGDDGRCRIYAARPLGCRTFFCERASGPGRVPRDVAQRFVRDVADLAARFSPTDPGARPFSRVLAARATR
jgi:Fe-S-cluster containining protein